jgi:DNA end-binding protein Ku
LNQLHNECNSRVKYSTVCPICGDISRNEIVKGYEYAKDQYVIIDLAELEKLRASDEGKAIRIDCFVTPDQLDPIYFGETSYFLAPDGAAGQKPYALIKKVMEDRRLYCVARIVLHNKEQLVVIRVVDGVLCMTGLKYTTQVKSTDLFSDMIRDEAASKQELKLAEKLIVDTINDSFDLADYGDQYTERLQQLIQAKIEGKEVVATPSAEAPPVINLMDALKASVEQAKSRTGSPLKTASGPRTAKRPTRSKAVAAKKKSTDKAGSSATESLKDKLASAKKTQKSSGKKKTG